MKRNIKQFSKCIGAVALSLAMMTGNLAGFVGPKVSNAISGEVTAHAADYVLSNADRNAIFEGTRTDFRDESIYFAMITRFYNGDESNDVQCWDGTQYNLNDPAWRGDFKGLIEQLDYIKALGFTAIWITPVVENISGYDYHGYHASNFSKVDERYESNDCTYQDLIDAVHAKGMKIIQDVVFNHTGNFGETNLMPMFEKQGDLSSADCLVPSANTVLPDNYNELTPTQQYQARLALMKNTDGVNHDVNNIYHHYGNFNWDDYTCQLAQIAGDCVDLNTENPLVYNYIVDAYTKYIDMGVDAFRVDTVRHISRLTFNKVFNDAFHAAAAKNGNNNFFMFGEVCTRDNGNYWYRQSPSMSTPYYTWKDSKDYAWSDTDWEVNYNSAIQNTKDNADNISEQPTSTNALLNGNEYHTPDYSQFSGLSVIDFPMHWSFKDAGGAFAVAKSGDKYYNDATWNVTYVDSHDYAPDGAPEDQRFAGSQETWAENLSLMFTFRGIPCIYYGSETEFQKGKTIDKGPNMALADSGRAYYGDYLEGNVTATGFGSYGNVSGTVKETLSHPLSQHIQRLNRIRQAVPALRKGQYSTEGVSGNLAFKRRYTDATTDSFACVAISSSATFSGVPNGKYVDAVTGDVKNVTNGTLSVSVSGQGNLKCYVLDTAKTPAPGRVVTNGKYLTDGGAATLIEYDNVKIVEETGVTVSKSSVSVPEGESEKVTATVLPADASNKTVTWTSSDTKVATVAGGKITGITPGKATITAKTSNGKTATVSVTVTVNTSIVKPTGITVSKNSVSLVEGSSEQITATVLPADATDKTVTWTSADKSIATVDSTGKITAVLEGSTTVTATTYNGFSQTVLVTVKEKSIKNLGEGVYFEKPAGWGNNINVYLWDKANGDKQYAGTWPGSAMTDLGDGVYGYSFKADESAQGMMVIFNDGSGNQTADLTYTQNGLFTTSGLKKVLTFEEKKEGTVTVRYVDESGAVLGSDSYTGTVGTAYATTAKTFTGYTLKTTPTNAKGTYTETGITVTYVYQKNTVSTLSGVLKVNGNTGSVNATVGSNVTFNMSATGGSGSYQYKIVLNNITTGKSSVIKSYSSASSMTAKLNTAGVKEYVLYVKDGTGKEVKGNAVRLTGTSSSFTGTLTVNGSTGAVTASVGSTVTFKMSAAGGSGSYQYKIVLNNLATGKTSVIKNYDGAATKTAKLSTAGVKEYVLYVKDSTGKEVKGNTVRLTGTNSANLTGTMTVNNATSDVVAVVGSTVTYKMSAAGGSGSYQYKIVLNNVTTGKTSVIKNYDSAAIKTAKLSTAGIKEYTLYVKDSTGKEVKANTVRLIGYNGTTPENITGTLKVNNSTSDVVAAVGSTVTFKMSATGGSGSYQYKIVLNNITTGKTSVIKNYDSATTKTAILSTAGIKEYVLYVKDSSGKEIKANTVRLIGYNK